MRVDPALLVMMLAIIIQWRSVFRRCIALAQNQCELSKFSFTTTCICNQKICFNLATQLTCATQCTLTSFNLTLPLPYLNLPSSSSTLPYYLPYSTLPYSSLTWLHLPSKPLFRIIYHHLLSLALAQLPLIYLQMPSLNITCLCFSLLNLTQLLLPSHSVTCFCLNIF